MKPTQCTQMEGKMKKVISLLTLLLCISFGTMDVFGASDKCVVKESNGQTVVLECNKKSGNFKIDDKVKVKTVRTKRVEGC